MNRAIYRYMVPFALAFAVGQLAGPLKANKADESTYLDMCVLTFAGEYKE